MNYKDALTIAEDLRRMIEPACEPGMTLIGGGLRRHKQDVHDIEIIAQPILKAPVPTFGVLDIFQTPLDKLLYDLEKDGLLRKVAGGQKRKNYKINLNHYGLESLNGFSAEFYLATPPTQWGVEVVIRTGPGSEQDNFSRQCVTNVRPNGGFLPDGYRVRHLAVWHAEQLDMRGEPLKGQSPVEMPEEIDFLKFLNLGWIEPRDRHARWRANGSH